MNTFAKNERPAVIGAKPIFFRTFLPLRSILAGLFTALLLISSLAKAEGVVDADFFTAIDNENLPELESLIKRDADVHKLRVSGKNELNLLHYAAKYGMLDVVNLLVQKGADLDLHSSTGKTALMYAAKYGNLEIAKLLVGKGADTEIRTRITAGKTALDYALSENKTKVEDFLAPFLAKSNNPKAYEAYLQEAGKAPYSSEAIAADLDQLQKILETESSYLYLKGLDLNTEMEKIKNELKGGATKTELGLKVEKLVGSIGDRHSKVSGFRRFPETHHALPFALASLSGKDQKAVALLPTDNGQYKLFLPDYPYLKSIDNMGLTEVIDKLDPRQKHAPREAKFYRGLDSLRYISRLYYRLGKPVPKKIAFTFSNGKTEKTVLLPPLSGSEAMRWHEETFESGNEVAAKIESNGLASIFRKIDDDIGYIRIPSMWGLNKFPNLFETFNQEMSNFKDTKALIIDIRNNGGGRRDILAALAPYFMAPDAPSFVANMARVRMDQRLSEDIESMQHRYLYDYGSAYLSDRDRDAIDIFTQDFKEEWDYDRDRFSGYYYMVFNHDKGKNHYYYDKPVYILVNERCFSAASVLTTALNGLGKVKIVGIRTDGSSGRSRNYGLTNTGLGIKLSSMISFQRNGKTLDTNGTVPDIEIERDMQQILGNRDSQLEKLIDIIGS